MGGHGSHEGAPPELLFVDYREDNPQNRAIDKQKRVFAQRTHQWKKRQAAVERLKTSTHVFRQRLPFAYKPVADSSDASTDERGRHDGEDPAPAAAGTYVPHSFMEMARMAKLFSPQTYLGQGFVDPFGTTAVPMDEHMNMYFHHLRNFTLIKSYPLDISRMSVWWWQQALSQPAIQLALLVSAAGQHKVMSTLNNAPFQCRQRSHRQLLRLRGYVINMLNDLLRNPGAISESTILVVALFRAIEAISGNVEDATAHTKGLEVLIQLNGGLETLDHMTLSQIYHGDTMYATLTGTFPHLPLVPRWRGEILQEANIFHSTSDIIWRLEDKPDEASRLSMLGTSFSEAPWYPGLEDSMKTFLRISQRLVQYYEVARLRPSIIMPTDNDLFVLLKHQLVAIRYPVAAAGPSGPLVPGSSLLNEPLRITLLIYLHMRTWHFQNIPIMRYMVNSLQQILLLCKTIRQTAPDALFWILFIGGMASRGYNGHSWFVSQLAEISRYLALRDWATAREVLGGFFYTDQPDEPGGEELWDQVALAG
ncbi:hypothetical protein BJX63DRAFT_120268 [Aspergillus granulosus]|uniref:Uncharacterized protein n=1 Tax=Aspergillus granulosus TaxID=176169 RepID=A0ABR4GTR3_9EURO